jgi:hypothetical protein
MHAHFRRPLDVVILTAEKFLYMIGNLSGRIASTRLILAQADHIEIAVRKTRAAIARSSSVPDTFRRTRLSDH